MSDVNVVFLSKSRGLCPTPLTKLNKTLLQGGERIAKSPLLE